MHVHMQCICMHLHVHAHKYAYICSLSVKLYMYVSRSVGGWGQRHLGLKMLIVQNPFWGVKFSRFIDHESGRDSWFVNRLVITQILKKLGLLKKIKAICLRAFF